MMKKCVVITGADGFIGSNLTLYLSNMQYDVYSIIMKDSPTRWRIETIDRIHIVECDLMNYELVLDMLPMNPEAVFHFAWQGVTPSDRDNIELQKYNIELSLSVVKMAHMIGAKKFIFPGSTLEYSYKNQLINSNAIPCPQNAYGVSKIAAKYYTELFCKRNSISFIYTVISGIYSEKRIDNNVIYYTISSLLKKEKPKLTKLEQLWDYVHIDDVICALELIVRKGKDGAFYTIGHGDNWALSNYIYIIRDLIDSNLPLGIGEIPYNNNIVPMSCVDLTSLYEDTGFVPVIDFSKGIRLVIEKIKEGI